jgi:phosphatidylserine/phosphatidylglycerophosphate/cardiolipin synthase-like enzyme
LEDAIDSANSSIDILLSNAELRDNDLWDDIVDAYERGVVVRVLLDESDWAQSITEKNRPTIEFLKSCGIEARFDDASVTTHAKLVVIDKMLVVLGSSNWNARSFLEHEQADVLVKDTRIGKAFSSYFERLWGNTLFPGAVRLPFDGTLGNGPLIIPIPETEDTKNYASVLLALVAQATQSVHVVMYRISYYPQYQESITNDILNALIGASARGLDVRVFIDDCAYYESDAQANLQAARYLSDHGVNVRMDDPTVTTHAKLIIIDGLTTIIGSTNWNYYSLAKNNETDIAFIECPEIAKPYEAFFESLWNKGRKHR